MTNIYNNLLELLKIICMYTIVIIPTIIFDGMICKWQRNEILKAIKYFIIIGYIIILIVFILFYQD